MEPGAGGLGGGGGRRFLGAASEGGAGSLGGRWRVTWEGVGLVGVACCR